MKTLDDYQPYLRPLSRYLAREVEFFCEPDLETILNRHPQLIVVASHGSPWSWLVLPCYLSTKVVDNGGGRRVPLGIYHQALYQIPFVKALIQFISQEDLAPTYDRVRDLLRQGKVNDVVLLPEGMNSFFGNVDDLRKFKSFRFIELAWELQLPLLSVVHLGSEGWSLPVPLSPIKSLIPRQFRRHIDVEGDLFNLPFLLRPMKSIKMHCELIQLDNLPNYHSLLPKQRRKVIKEEGEKFRDRMFQKLEEIKNQR